LADPWLPQFASETTGNNVDAYADLVAGDGFSAGDIRANTTSANTFDYTYDTAQAPGATNNQIKASVTSLFYLNNWLHDYFYDSGFDEAGGNAQVNNFGRGGAQNDPLRVEAQDFGGDQQCEYEHAGGRGVAANADVCIHRSREGQSRRAAAQCFDEQQGCGIWGRIHIR
jgi:hypothetical protein